MKMINLIEKRAAFKTKMWEFRFAETSILRALNQFDPNSELPEIQEAIRVLENQLQLLYKRKFKEWK